MSIYSVQSQTPFVNMEMQASMKGHHLLQEQYKEHKVITQQATQHVHKTDKDTRIKKDKEREKQQRNRQHTNQQQQEETDKMLRNRLQTNALHSPVYAMLQKKLNDF